MGELLDDPGFFLRMTDEDENDYGDGYGRPRTKTCNRCGAGDLHWQPIYKNPRQQDSPMWRLYDTEGQLHRCKEAT